MRALAFCAFLFAPACLAQVLITDPNLTIDYLASTGFGSIGIDFGPNGRLYFAEKRGRVMVMQRDTQGNYGTPTQFADLSANVYSTGESGMLGLALDPDFASNRYMYLFYTSNFSDQRLVRVQADTTYNVVSGGELVLLSGLPRAATNHKAGDIGFRPGEPDYIYVALGDDANIAQAGNMSVYHGKMLRLNKANGHGLMNNPFYSATNGTDHVSARIWSFGYRNPFRIAFHPGNPVPDAIYSSENGGPGGVTLQDRITWIRAGANGNWNSTSASAGNNSEFYFPPNPTEIQVLERQTSSMIGIDIAVGGVFADPQNPGSATLFCSNFYSYGTVAGAGSISRWRLTGTNHNQLATMPVDGGVPFVRNLYATDVKVGPDGWLYFTQSTGGTSSGASYRVGRIRTLANVAPVASFTTSPDPATGAAPLNVQFTDTSTDIDGTIVSRLWDFGNGQTSAAVNPSMNYPNPGLYMVTLTVTDDDAAQHQAQKNVSVLAPPVAAFTMSPVPAEGPVPLMVQFTDASTDSDGTITSRLWNFGNGQTSTATNPAMTYNASGFYTVTLTVTDNHNLQNFSQQPVHVYFPPVASFTMNPDPAQGAVPLVVQFTDTSTDADGTIASRLWAFGNGQTSTTANPTMTYTNSGAFAVTLTVTDNHGLQQNTQKSVDVFFATQLTLTGTALDARSITPSPLGAATELRLYRNDGLTPLPFTGGLGPNQNAIAVPPGGAFNATVSVQLTSDGVVVSAGEPAGDGMAAQYIGFALSPMAPSHTQPLTFNLSSLAVGGRILVAGQPALVDFGVARNAANELYAFAGARDYLPASAIVATGVNHRAQSDPLGYFYVPVLSGHGATSFFFDFVGDTGAAQCVPFAQEEFLPASGLVARLITLGAQSAPGTRDSLAAIAATSRVDFNSQIQPILSANCAGCHSSTSPRGGLTLAPGLSHAALLSGFSAQVPALRLVQPGDATQSYLFDKVNAHQPQVGVRMGQGAVLTLQQQALLRDWINQGALPAAPPPEVSSSSDVSCVAHPAAGVMALCLLGLLLFALRRRDSAA